MLEATADDRTLATEPSDGQPQLVAKLRDRWAAQVSGVDPLEVVSDTLIRVEIRGVARWLLQPETLSSTRGQEILDDLGAVDGSPVPDHQQLTREVTQ